MRARLVGLAAVRDAAANREVVRAALAEARGAGARLVVLPEYAAAFDPRGVGRDLAEPLDGPFTAALAEAGAGMTVLAGTVLPGGAEPGGDGRGVNTVVAVRDGTVVGSYAKVHLYDAFGRRESDRLVPGPADAAPLVVDVDGLGVGVLTCYDLRFPESARRVVDAGADVLAVPAAWASGPGKADQWLTLLRARAIENVAYVLGVAMRGPGVTGDLVVVDPAGVVVARSARGVLDAELDRAVVTEARRINPSLENRRYRVVPW
ncbi:nitrilase-related carbon-nitrogen hydrolase [Isoptericola sp. b441]|uniref:Nitrilase-related carbon-nitrogen hydrolase n=1 Tax=Actinotalea lenta TaxID=3064654 RepID=A0ABT9D7L2_9CELL|nr:MULTISPECIES: nitrilase-related carbon-nitrogen hydrolase [unclassified Isoptericola]MDO8106849.1 nitrilase-related carbon-nitrogen hydrolase [Isoptericola sp. b441]MDO8121440.1 nitrilase-related carbon-nitrogen hydrolase [Isoptericola sp. b490]